MNKLKVTDIGIVDETTGDLIIPRDIFVEAFDKYIRDNLIYDIEENSRDMINRSQGYYGDDE